MAIDRGYGTVFVRNYVPCAKGKAQAYRGDIEVLEAAEALGLKVARGESNWFAVVRGTTSTAYVPGCEVMGIHLHSRAEEYGLDTYEVP